MDDQCEPGIVAVFSVIFNGKRRYSTGLGVFWKEFSLFCAQLFVATTERFREAARNWLRPCRRTQFLEFPGGLLHNRRQPAASTFRAVSPTVPARPVSKKRHMSAHRSRLDFALHVSQRAAETILNHYRSQTLGVESKADDSPVTVADKGAERLIRDALATDFPEDGILGEEFDDVPARNGYRWVLDPIDGTKPFIYGVPLFGTLIGIEFEGRMVAGVCRLPALDEVMYAADGDGAWWKIGDADPIRARVSGETDLSKARLMFTEPTSDIRCGRGEVLPQLLNKVRIARGWGDCYGHMLVATGRADIAVDPQMSAWDIAALIPIVREAGGSCTDWKGDENIVGGDGVSVAPGLKDAVLGLLEGAPPIRRE